MEITSSNCNLGKPRISLFILTFRGMAPIMQVCTFQCLLSLACCGLLDLELAGEMPTSEFMRRIKIGRLCMQKTDRVG